MFLYTDWQYILSVKVALLLKIEYTIFLYALQVIVSSSLTIGSSDLIIFDWILSLI